MIHLTGMLYARVIFACPVGQPPSWRHSSSNPGPAASWIAPSTPPPPNNVVFAALTMASTFCLVILPSTTAMRLELELALIFRSIYAWRRVCRGDRRIRPSTCGGPRADLSTPFGALWNGLDCAVHVDQLSNRIAPRV